MSWYRLHPKPDQTLQIPNGQTRFVDVPVVNGCVGAFIRWTNAAAASPIALQYTSLPPEVASTFVAGTVDQWVASGVVIVGPTGVGVGCAMVNQAGVRQRRARLVIGPTTANSDIEVWPGISDSSR